MKKSLKTWFDYKVKSQDGSRGRIKDFLFDQEDWMIRYVDADFGTWFTADRVLIPVVFMDEANELEEIFPVRLSKDMIESGPRIEDHLPVSRQFEKELAMYYDLRPYWPFTYSASSSGALYFPPRPIGIPKVESEENEPETKLRSFRELEGYHILAGEKDVGRIVDLFVDEDDCQIIYALADLSGRIKKGKKVLLSVEGMEEISFIDQVVRISVSPEKLMNAPDYIPDSNITEEREKELYDYFSWGMVI